MRNIYAPFIVPSRPGGHSCGRDSAQMNATAMASTKSFALAPSIPRAMRGMVFRGEQGQLSADSLPTPKPGSHQILLKVLACGVCRTDLHVVDLELPAHRLPVVPGHEIVGRIVKNGEGAARFAVGDRVGVPWLAFACGVCTFCRSERENLCESPAFTGYDVDGGYAEYAVADERFCFALPSRYPDLEAAPLLCAGLIGYRALRMAGDAQRLGIYGFGAAAHIIVQVAAYQGREVFAFTRPADQRTQTFARELGATWAGGADEPPPRQLDAALIFAPAGELVPLALAAVTKGGVVVCAGIHMTPIPSFSYDLLWGERSVRSVANLTRADGDEFFELAAKMRLQTHVRGFPLRMANEALDALRRGMLQGAAVLVP
jgi:propanol-preferring alcohol dehydrogenase